MADLANKSIGLIARTLLGAMAMLCAQFICLDSASAQATWEYSPYQINVLVASEGEEAASLFEQVKSSIQSASRGSAGYAWKVDVQRAPAAVNHDIVHRLDLISFDRLAGMEKKLVEGDKIVTLGIARRASTWDIRVRELDLASRQWADLVEASTAQVDAVGPTASSLLVGAIRPILKVEKVAGKMIIGQPRAGGLVVKEDSVAAMRLGAILQPIVRRNKRDGQPLKNGIYAPAWSYLTVESQAGNTVSCTLISGYGNVIPAKGGPRTQRLALLVQPRYESTRLELVARQPASAGNPQPSGRPLAGYEVFAKKPGTETSDLVGLTDATGSLQLDPDDKGVQLFYIRNGGQLLARLPLVVGHHETAIARVLDDDVRLRAEMYIKGLQSRVMDLVARREILAVRARSKLKKGDVAGAKKLVEEFRSLPTRIQLDRELQTTRQEFRSASGLTARRIAKLFDDGQRLVHQFLDPAAGDVLAREVAEAERSGPPSAGTQPVTADQAAPSSGPSG